MTRRRKLIAFLALLTAVQFGFPVTFHTDLVHAAYPFLYGVMFLFGVEVVRSHHGRIAPILVVTVCFFACAVWYAVDLDSPIATLCLYIASGAFMVTVLLYLVRFIFVPSDAAGPDLILAAVCVYLLIGGVFGVAFGTLETVAPGGLEDAANPDGPVPWQHTMYYSYVTLATLGYGDVLPISPWARSLAILETVAGTLFLATVIARLIGAYSSAVSSRRPPPPDEGPPVDGHAPDGATRRVKSG